MNTPPIADRPCSNCEAWMTADDVFDMWGDEPHPMQVVCYECPECEAVTGYFRNEVRNPEEHLHMSDKEFYCPTRRVYERLYGDEDAFFHIDPETTMALPTDIYDSLTDRGVDMAAIPDIEFVPMVLAPDHALTIERGATLVLSDTAFDTFHQQLLGEWKGSGKDDWKGDWFVTHNLRVVRAGSDAAAHHNPAVQVDDE